MMSPPSDDDAGAAPAPDRVLIVDDDDDAADALGMTLECFGHQVMLARSGPEALERVASSVPGAALIDLALPIMDGFEVARRLRASHPTTLLIALTGFGDEHNRRAAEQAGFDRYLLKPISGRELDAVLRSVMRPPR